MVDIESLAQEILNFTNGISVFLYGSRARDDFYDESDYEIGVLMKESKYIERSVIKKQFNEEGANIFPFRYENFIQNAPDTPFVKSIYMREIIESGKTVAGEKIIEKLKPPSIMLVDLIQDVRFNLGYALAATHSFRSGDNATASLHMAKSCLFGTRDCIVLKLKIFPISYDEILELSNKLEYGSTEIYKKLPNYAYNLRKRNIEVEEQYLFRNISYLNQLVEPQLIDRYKSEGNIRLL
jgi:hypothetical protein